MPQAHFSPAGSTFSVAARSQVHSPAALARHEHRAPATVFSVEALLQLQARADCLPQEQVACWAQTQASDLPQQVVGLTILTVWWCRVVVWEVGVAFDSMMRRLK